MFHTALQWFLFFFQLEHCRDMWWDMRYTFSPGQSIECVLIRATTTHSLKLGFNVSPWEAVPPGLYSLRGQASYRRISWSLEARRLDVTTTASLQNLTGISAMLLPCCLSNFRAIGKFLTRISRLRDFTRSYGKTSVGSVNKGSEICVESLIQFFYLDHVRSLILTLWSRVMHICVSKLDNHWFR